jgi:hypothetical protein
MLDLSFYQKGDLAHHPIVIKTPDAIWKKAQNVATLCAVAFFSGLVVWLIFR